MKLTKNFDSTEFKCSCCGQVEINKTLIDKLQELRDYLKKPIYITSGYRCNEYNKKISKNTVGQHCTGEAVDIGLSSRHIRHKIIGFIIKQKFFKDIALGKDFIHLGKGNKYYGIGIY